MEYIDRKDKYNANYIYKFASSNHYKKYEKNIRNLLISNNFKRLIQLLAKN